MPFFFTGVDLKSAPDVLSAGRLRRCINCRPAIEAGLKPRQGTTLLTPAPLADLNVHTVRFLNDPVLSATLYYAGAGTKLRNILTGAQLDSGYSGHPLSEVDYRLGGSSSPYAIIGDFNQMRKMTSAGAMSQLGITPPAAGPTSAVQAAGNTSIETFDADAGFTYVAVASHSSVAGKVGNALKVVTNSGVTAKVEKVAAIDLSVSGPLSASDADYIHLWVNIDNPANLAQMQVIIDVDPSSVLAGALTATAFTQNYYWANIQTASFQQVSTASQATLESLQQNLADLQASLAQVPPVAQAYSNLPAQIQQLQSQILNAQVAAGASQWTELTIPRSAFQRAGTGTYNWSGVQAFAVIITTVAGQAVTAILDAFYQFGGAGPDSSVGVKYDWRYTYYDSVSLSESNGSPVQAALQAAQKQPVTQTAAASADGQVDTIRWWRRGGTLSSAWYNVGKQANAASFAVQSASWLAGVATITTTAAHGFASGQGVTISGVNPAGYNGTYKITVTGTTTFTYPLTSNPGAWVSGGSILFADVASDSAIVSGLQLSLTNDVPVTTVNSSGVSVSAQALEFIWGPYGGNTLFGCGDPNRPGYAYWSNSGNPDAWSSLNNVEVTQPSDPLQNGFIWNGRTFVFSKEKLYELQPTPIGSTQSFFPVDMQAGSGLFARWGVEASPHTPLVWFIGKDGVYEWAGGAASVISNDLWPLFHSATVEGNAPIDFTQEDRIKLRYFDGELRFTFQDTGGGNQTWICDVFNGHRWRQASYPWAVRDIYAQPETTNLLLMSGNDGNAYKESESALSDNGTAISCDIRTGAFNAGDPRPKKLFGDSGVDLDAQGETVTVTPGFDSYTRLLASKPFSQTGRVTGQVDFNSGAGQEASNLTLDIAWSSSTKTPVIFGWSPSLVIRPEDTLLRYTDPEDAGYMGAKHVRGIIIEADTANLVRTIQVQGDSGTAGAFQNENTPLSVQHNGQSEIPYFFVPFIAHNLRLAPTDSNPWRLYRWKWVFDPYPELSQLYSAWTDDGFPGAKFVQGMILEADTGGAAVTLQIQSDGGTLSETLSVNHNGRIEIAYPQAAGDWVPFTTHQLRIVPQGAIRIFGVRWVWEPVPELATRWRTQSTTHDLRGWQHIYDGYVAHISTADLTYTITPDVGSAMVITIPNSGGAFAKSLFQCPPNKFKSCYHEISSLQPARIFLKDCEVHVAPWGQDYVSVRPFGDLSRTAGARI